MLQKRNDASLLAMASYGRKRYSEATEIFDTDFEADYSDEESSTRRSDELVSLHNPLPLMGNRVNSNQC